MASFDCIEEVDNLKDAWSPAQIAFCCLRHGIHCSAHPSNETDGLPSSYCEKYSESLSSAHIFIWILLALAAVFWILFTFSPSFHQIHMEKGCFHKAYTNDKLGIVRLSQYIAAIRAYIGVWKLFNVQRLTLYWLQWFYISVSALQELRTFLDIFPLLFCYLSVATKWCRQKKKSIPQSCGAHITCKQFRRARDDH